MIAGIAYYIYFGYHTSWWYLIPLFIASTIGVGFTAAIIGRIVPEYVQSLLGFLAMPISGLMMFKTLPIA